MILIKHREGTVQRYRKSTPCVVSKDKWEDTGKSNMHFTYYSDRTEGTFGLDYT